MEYPAVMIQPDLTPRDTTYAILGVLREVARERGRQDEKWGEQNHDLPVWITVLGEEFGELAQAVLESRTKGPHPTDWLAHAREEAIQVAAVAVATVEYLDRARYRREQA